MPSPGGKGVDHILLCTPERASLAPPPPATFLAKVKQSKNSKVLKDFLWRHENVKNTVVLECFADHNLVIPPAGRAENAFSEGGKRMVNQEDSFHLDKLLKSQKNACFFQHLG